MPAAVRRTSRRSYGTLVIRDFSGGLNLRDAPSEVAPNESPECMNVTLDERGGVVKRLGLTRVDANAISASATNLYYWQAKNTSIIQDGAIVKRTDNFSSYTNLRTFSSSARVVFVDFKELLVMVHPVDGVYTYDGTTVTAIGSSPKGTCAAAWQNKVFVGGDPTSGSKGRVWWCAAGDVTSWPGTNFVDLREVDDAPVNALGVGQQFDVQANPTLLVCKGQSTYRIYDSATGAFQTLHTQAGASSALALTTAYGRTAMMNSRGIWLTDGVSPPVLASDKLSPLFDHLQINFSQHDKWCAGNAGNRVVFSFTYGSGQTTNNRTLEYHPQQGWFTIHDFGASCFTGYESSTRRLYGCSPTNGHTYETFSGWTDDGATIASRWQTRWFEPVDGFQARIRRLLVEGRGLFGLYVKSDYTLDQGELQNVNIPNIEGETWNTAQWNFDVWGTQRIEGFEQFFSLGVVRSLSFNMTEATQSQVSGHPLLSDGASKQVGSFACYGLHVDFVSLAAS